MQIALKNICNVKSTCVELDLATSVNKQQSDFCHFERVLILGNFASTKFLENRSLAKISEYTESCNIDT